jgi:parvulin-like peptidyl-prolyl isomerase
MLAGRGRESLVSVSRRHRRATVLGPVAAAVVAALLASACQSRAGTAAIVGDQRITDDSLQSLVSEALAAPGVRAALPNSSYKGDLAQYRRNVLFIEVRRILAEKAAARVGLAVSDAEVADRYRLYEQTNGGPTSFPAQLASALAYSPALFRERVRSEVILADLGYRVGGVRQPTDAELRASYAKSTLAAPKWTLQLVRVPDEVTARTVQAQIQQDPASLATVAKKYGGQSDPQDFTQDQLPPDIVAKLGKSKPGDVFTYIGPSSSGTSQIYVIKFDTVTRPTFESSRAQLLSQSVSEAMTAGQKYLATQSNTVPVEINPRYGSWDSSKLSITDFINPVVKATPTPSPSASDTAAPEPSPTGG